MSLEFDVIEQYFKRRYQRSDIVVENGDDCAVLAPAPHTHIAITTDTLVEGVHFLADTPAERVAYKALAVNLSDLAAMGAVPAWFTLALTLPEPDPRWLENFSMGLFELADPLKFALIGGDTTKGPLSITVTAMGRLRESTGSLRSSAKAGDDIYVTGTLGDAALGLKALLGEMDLPAAHHCTCVERLQKPTPRVSIGLALAPYIHAMIDCSDGFSADLLHILNASRVAASIKVASLPLTEAVRTVVEAQDDWSLPLAGGDDYELIFTASTSQRGMIASLLDSLDCPISWVGSILEGEGLSVEDVHGQLLILSKAGYSHF